MALVRGSWTSSRPDTTLADMAAGEMLEIFVDYSLVGVGRRRFQTRVKAIIRRRLRTGDTVVVHGDDVAPAWARLLAVADDSPDVELELCSASS